MDFGSQRLNESFELLSKADIGNGIMDIILPVRQAYELDR